jgi:hypothetical protein
MKFSYRVVTHDLRGSCQFLLSHDLQLKSQMAVDVITKHQEVKKGKGIPYQMDAQVYSQNGSALVVVIGFL